MLSAGVRSARTYPQFRLRSEVLDRGYADFRELRTGEVPRILLLGISVHKPRDRQATVEFYAALQKYGSALEEPRKQQKGD